MSKIEYDINISDYVEDQILKRFREVVFETWRRLSIYTPAIGTPYGTGRAKANWQVKIGGDNEDWFDSTRSSQPVGIQDMGRSQTDVIQVLAALKSGDTVVIFNNVPYIEKIEYGWPAKYKPPTPGYHVVERAVSDINRKYGR